MTMLLYLRQNPGGSYRKLIFFLSATALISLAYAGVAREGAACGSDSDCLGRRICHAKVCKKKMPLGGNCADPFWICSDGYTCDKAGPKPLCMNILKKGATKCMANRYTKCAPGLQCSGSFGSAVCDEEKGSAPSRKSTTPAPRTAATKTTLSKDGGKCKIDGDCVEPLSCLGKPESLRCKMKKPVGMQCGDPTWVCQDGLDCKKEKSSDRYGKCVKPLSKYGEECGKDTDCIKPLYCVGKPGPRVCKQKRPPGGKCRDSTCCQNGLDCEKPKGSTHGTCIKTLNQGDPCSGKKFDRCSKGEACITGKCREPIPTPSSSAPAKQSASSAPPKPSQSSSPVPSSSASPKAPSPNPSESSSPPPSSKASAKPLTPPPSTSSSPVPSPEPSPSADPKPIKDGFPCESDGECVTGLSCLGIRGNRRCKMRKPVGGQCGDPTWQCQLGLECFKKKASDRYGTCIKPLAKNNEKCGRDSDCEQPFSCLGKPESLRCKMKKPVGGRCGDPSWRCQDGLECLKEKSSDRYGICIKALTEGSPCTFGRKFERCNGPDRCISGKCRKATPLTSSSNSAAPSSALKPSKSDAAIPSPKASRTPNPSNTSTPAPSRKPSREPAPSQSASPGPSSPASGLPKPSRTSTPVPSSEPSQSYSAAPLSSSKASRTPAPKPSKPASPEPSPTSSTSPKPKPIKDGFPCRQDSECSRSLRCVGVKGNTRCKMPKPVGGKCGDPTWICSQGLSCEKGKGRYGRCVKTLDEGAPCTGVKLFERCTKGTKCISGKCQEPVQKPPSSKPGTRSRSLPVADPSKSAAPVPSVSKSAPEPSLSSSPVPSMSPRAPEPAPLKDGFPCAKDSECEQGLSCLGRSGNRRCKTKEPLGGRCGDPLWICSDSLDCVKTKGRRYGTCMKTLRRGAPCSKKKFERCTEGYYCLKGKCRKPIRKRSKTSKSSTPRGLKSVNGCD